jgi:protein MPE1
VINHSSSSTHQPAGLAEMASYVYFKFKSQKEPQRVTIDGPHTDVWNLKREIITISRLGDGTDFDLKIYKENSNEGQ